MASQADDPADPADQPFIELAEHAIDVYPDSLHPRPARKNTFRPVFPQGFSPWNDQRDPSIDPDAYPPPIRNKFEGFVNELRSGTHPLFRKVWRYWPRVPRLSAVAKIMFKTLMTFFGPIWLHVILAEIWRHFNGWLFYVFYYVLGTQGYFVQSEECLREFREGPNRRFTISTQFWHRRGCEGGTDGLAHRGELITTMVWGLISLVRSSLLGLPQGVVHFVLSAIFWGFIGGYAWDRGFYVYKYVVWMWVRRILPLIKDVFDFEFIYRFLLQPWVNKLANLWTALWAAFLGFDIHAHRPRGEPGSGQGVPIDNIAELFFEPDDDEDDGGDGGSEGGDNLVENENDDIQDDGQGGGNGFPAGVGAGGQVEFDPNNFQYMNFGIGGEEQQYIPYGVAQAAAVPQNLGPPLFGNPVYEIFNPHLLAPDIPPEQQQQVLEEESNHSEQELEEFLEGLREIERNDALVAESSRQGGGGQQEDEEDEEDEFNDVVI